MSNGMVSDVYTFVHSSTEPQHALGTVKTTPDGKAYRYIRNNATTAISTAGYPAVDVGTVGSWVVSPTVTAATQACRGVYMAAMAVSEYGWIQCKGLYESAYVTAAVATLGYPLKIVTLGYFDLADAAGDPQCGIAGEIVTAAVTDGTFAVHLNCP